MAEPARYPVGFSPKFDRIFKSIKKRKPSLVPTVLKGIDKIAGDPMLGKPLRNVLRNHRGLHIADSFVLLYEITTAEIRLLDFDHHDKIYKKYR